MEDDITKGGRVMLWDVIQWAIVSLVWWGGQWTPGTRSHHEMRDKMMDLKARSSPRAESGQVCASVPGPGGEF